MNILLVLPVLIPITTASLCLLAWRYPRVQRYLCVLGSAALLLASVWLLAAVWRDGILATQPGNWPAPFGITLVADLLSAIMTVLAAIMGLAIVIYSTGTIDARRVAFGYYPLLQIMMMGVCGAFLTGDMFNLYVWFEVLLLASFVLLALGGERAQLEGAIKYVTLNLISSTLFLTAAGLLYALVGTLNMADLAVKLRGAEHQGLITTLAMLFLVSFGIKAGVFPLFFWLPASYHTPPFAVSALFAGLLTKVGVYALMRVFTLIFVGDVGYTHTLLLIIAGLTMVTGVLGAVAQNEVRRILSFHIVSQIGYMVMGLGLLSPLALAGSIFYIIHHIIVKTNLFLIGGVIHRLCGSGELKRTGGLYAAYPALAVLFLIPALSLAGIPPFSGFFAKLVLIRSALEIEQYAIAAVALAVGLLTVFSMTKIWSEAFWKPAPDDASTRKPDNAWNQRRAYAPALWLPMVSLATLTVAIGIGAGSVYTLSERAAQQLLDPSQYIQAVLGNNSVSATGGKP
jgi:multicomponent Na+:H+ antiporter subunit D